MIQIDMDMPKTCGDCPLSDPEMYCKLSGLDIAAFNRKRDDCPLKEVKHGKWIYVYKKVPVFNYQCSECGARSILFENFCSYCGADMRGN